MAGATLDDYLWATTEADSILGAFCFAFVEDATVDEVIESLPVVEGLSLMSGVELRDLSYEEWDGVNMLVGLVQVGRWTMMVEMNGYVGVTDRLMLPLSEGRRVLGHHYSDGNDKGRVVLFEDGRALTVCSTPSYNEPLGDKPKDIARLMKDVGFGMDRNPYGHRIEGANDRAAAFALCERITGIGITRGFVYHMDFEVVCVLLS